MSAACAWALDAPQTLHRSKSKTEPHVTTTRHSTTSGSATHSGIYHSTASRISATHRSGARVTGRTATASRLDATPVAHLRNVSYHRRHHYYERFTANSFIQGENGAGDNTASEDPVVRQAAIDALGDMNGTAVVINPANGRILAMVNQKLALSPGAEPCSTIKLTVALAALSESLVTSNTMVQLAGFRMDMTQALAKSNNLYFEELGRELGFERVRHYATQFGLGELAGYNIAGEQLGVYPDQPIPDSEGGVSRMCSFGQGVAVTPLQLGAFVAAIANGGTLYYLQHPSTAEDVAQFQPGSNARSTSAATFPTLKTAWPVRWNMEPRAACAQLPRAADLWQDWDLLRQWHSLWLVRCLLRVAAGRPGDGLLLEGGRATFGPRAAELTGAFYADLWDHDYFGERNQDAQSAPARGAVAPASPSSGSAGSQQ